MQDFLNANLFQLTDATAGGLGGALDALGDVVAGAGSVGEAVRAASPQNGIAVGDARGFDPATAVDGDAETIDLGDHGLTTGDAVRYDSGTFEDADGDAVGGLTHGATFHVSVDEIEPNKVRLHATRADALNGTRAIDLDGAVATGTGHGFQPFTAAAAIEDAPVAFDPAGAVDNGADTIDLGDHGLASGDAVRYDAGADGEADAVPVGGLAGGNTYFVSVDDAEPGKVRLHRTRTAALAGADAVDLDASSATGAAHLLEPASFGALALVDGATLDAGRDVRIGAQETVDVAMDTSFTFNFEGSDIAIPLTSDNGSLGLAAGADAGIVGGARVTAEGDVRVNGSVDTFHQINAGTALGKTTNSARAFIEDATVTALTGDVEVAGHSDAYSLFAAILPISEKPGMSGVDLKDSTSEMTNVVDAHIAEGAVVVAEAGAVNVTATDLATILVIADAITVSDPGVLGVAAVGFTMAAGHVANHVTAWIDGSTVTAGAGDVNVVAFSAPVLTSISAGIAVQENRLGLAGSMVSNTVASTIDAHIDGAALVEAAGSVRVRAIDLTSVTSLGGGVVVGSQLGVGAAVALNDVANTVIARIDQATVRALGGEVLVSARATPTVVVTTLGFAFADESGTPDPDGFFATIADFLLSILDLIGGIALAGSISVNDVATTVEAAIAGGANVSATTRVRVEAVDSPTIVAIAGAGAGVSGDGVAAGAAVSKNRIADVVTASVEGSMVAAPTVDVVADANADVDAIAIGGAGAEDFSLGGSVSLNEIANTIDAHVSDGSTITATAGAARVVASDDTLILAVSGAGAGSSGFGAVGAAFSMNDIAGNISASVAGSTIDASTIEIDARTNADIAAISIGGAGAENFALGGSVSLNEIANTVAAHVSDGSTLIATAGTARVSASDDTLIVAISGAGAGTSGFAAIGAASSRNDIGGTTTAFVDASTVTAGTVEVLAASNADIEALAAGGSGADTFAAGGSVVLNAIANTIDVHISNGANVKATDAVLVRATDAADIDALAGAGSGASTASVGVSLASNVIGNTTTAFIDDATVDPPTVDVVALSASDIVSIAGAGSGAGTVSGAGALTLNAIANTVDAHITGAGAVVTGSVVNVTATDASTIHTFAGAGTGAGTGAIVGSGADNDITNVVEATIGGGADVSASGALNVLARDAATIRVVAGAGSGAGTASGGAAVATNTIDNQTRARIAGAGTEASGASVSVTATSVSEILSITAIGSGAGTVSGTASVSVNAIDRDVEALVSTDAVVTSAGVVVVSATDDAIIRALAGSGSGAGTASIAAAVSVNTLSGTMRAAIDDATVSGTLVIVDAEATAGTLPIDPPGFDDPPNPEARIESIAIGGGGAGTVSAAGSASTNTIGQTVEAAIGNGADVDGLLGVSVTAGDASSILSIAGAGTGAGTASGGASVSLNDIANTVTARIEGSTVASGFRSVLVDAVSTATITSLSVIGSGAGTVSGAGSVALNYIGNTVDAHIAGGADVDAGLTVRVTASEDATIRALSGGGSGAGTVSAAAGIARNEIATPEPSDSDPESPADPANGTAVRAYIDGASVDGLRVEVRAVTSSLIETIAIGGSGAGTVSLAGSAAVNRVAMEVTGAIRNGADVQATGFIVVSADDRTDIHSLAGTGSGAGTVSGGASVGTNTVANTVSAVVDGAVVASSGGSVDVSAASTAEIDAITVVGSGAGTVSGAGSISLNFIGNTIAAHLSGGADAHAGGSLGVSARDASIIRALSGAGSGAGTASFGAALGTNTINSTVTAAIDGATATADGSIDVTAASDATIQSFTVGGSGAGTFALGGSVSLNAIANRTEASVLGGAMVTADGSIKLDASDDSDIDALAGGVAGAGSAAIGAALATNDIANLVRSAVENSTVRSDGGDVDLNAWSTAQIDSITAGGAGAGAFALGGSVSLNQIGSTLDAHVSGGADVEAIGRVGLSARDASVIQSLAGSAAGAGAAAIGAALATNVIADQARAFIDGAVVTAVGNDVDVTAIADATIRTLSAGLAGAGTVAISGAISLNDIANTVDAHIAGNADVAAGRHVNVLARDTSTIQSLSGQAAGAGGAGIGGAAAYNEIANTVIAWIDGSDVSTGADVTVEALADATIETISASGSGGTYVGIAGSVSINLIANDVRAWITGGAGVDADANLVVRADVDNAIRAFGGSIGAGAVGIGGSVAVSTLDSTTRAFIDNAAVHARANGGTIGVPAWNANTGGQSTENIAGLAVIASTDDDLDLISMTAGVGVVGVAGNVIVTNVNDVTEAYIDNSTVNSAADPGGAVIVRSHQDTDVDSGGGVIAGGVVGIGAVTNTVLVTNRTEAHIRDADRLNRTTVHGTDVEVNALTREHVGSFTAGLGVGVVGVAGSVAVADIDSDNVASITEADVHSQGNLRVLANDAADIDIFAGIIAGGAVGIGASIGVPSITNTTTAHITGGVTDARGLTQVKADSNESIDVAVGTAGVGLAGLAGSVAVSAIGATTRAFVVTGARLSRLNQDATFRTGAQDVQVVANDVAAIDDTIGTIGAGAVGVGVSVDVQTIANTTHASIGDNTRADAGRDVLVRADANRDLDTLTVAFGGGVFAGINAAVAVLSVGGGLDPEGADEANNMQGQVNGQIGQSGGVQNVNASDPTAQAAIDRTATSRYSVSDNLTTSPGTSDTVAWIGAHAVVSAGDDLRVQAESDTAVAMDVGGAAVGLVGVGGSVGIATIDTDTDAFVGGGATLSAGDVVEIASDADVNSSRIDAFAGAAGFVGLGAAVARFESDNDARAFLDHGAVVTDANLLDIRADTSANIDPDAFGVAIGAGAVGVVVADGSETGTTRAAVGRDTRIGPGVSDVSITAKSNDTIDVDATAAAGGIVSGQGSVADASVTPVIDAYIDDRAALDVTGSVLVSAESEGSANADSNGISVGGLAIGVSLAEATVRPNVDSHIDADADVVADGDVTVRALHNYRQSTEGVVTRVSKGATASANASGGGILAGNGADADADATALVDSAIRGDVEAGGSINVVARSHNDGDATGEGLTIGIVGIGVVFGDATASGTTRAFVDGANLVARGNLAIETQTYNTATGATSAPGGGIVSGSGSNADATVSPTVQAYITGGAHVDVRGNATLDVTAETDADADAKALNIGVVAVGLTDADTTVTPDVDVYINGSSFVSAAGSLLLGARHNVASDGSVIAGRRANAVANAAGGGFIAVESARPTATSNANVQTYIAGSARTRAGVDIGVTARSNNEAIADGNGDAFGVAGIGTVRVVANATGTTRAYVDAVPSMNAGDDLTVLAVGTNNAGATSEAASVGLIAGRESRATADSAPDVEAFVDGNGLLYMRGTTDIKAVALGDASATADGDGGGLGDFGISQAIAKWRPDVDAYIDDGTELLSDVDVNVSAFVNHATAGTKDTAKRAFARATSSSGGLVTVTGAEARAIVDSDVQARIDGRADVTAGDDVSVTARSRNKTDAEADGRNFGLAAIGQVKARGTMESETQALTGDGTPSDRTRISAGDDIRVRAFSDSQADVDATGGRGGLIGIGAAEATAELLNPDTNAIIGDRNVIHADDLLEVTAESRVSLSSDTDQSVTGAVVDNDSRATSNVTSADTRAEIGSDTEVNADRVEVNARDATVYAEAIADADVPFDLAGNNEARAVVNVDSDVLVRILGGGTDILGRDSVKLIADSQSVRTRTEAHTSTTGLTGNLRSVADNDKNVAADVIAEDGAHIETRDLTVEARAPHDEANRYIRVAETDADTVVKIISKVVDTVCTVIGEVVTLWGLLGDAEEVCEDIVETFEEILGADTDEDRFGSEVIENTIDFNADVWIQAAADPILVVDEFGLVTELEDISATNGTSAIFEGQTITGDRIVVNDITNTAEGKIVMRAPRGRLQGNTDFRVNTAFDTVTIHNHGPRHLYLNDITVYNKNPVEPAFTLVAGSGQNLLNYSLSTNAADTFVNIANHHPGDWDIILQGDIENPGGVTRIHNNGGSILSDPGTSINTRELELWAERGTIGSTATFPLVVVMPISPLLVSGITEAFGGAGVFLDLTTRTIGGRTADLLVDHVWSNTGNVDFNVRDAVRIDVDLLNRVTLTDGTVFEGTLLDNIWDPGAAVDSVANTIDLGFAHGLSNGEQLTYFNGSESVGGLRSGSLYSVFVVDDTHVQLGHAFDASSAVDGNFDTIDFGFDHGLQSADPVVYHRDGGTAVGGLVDGQTYFVRAISATAIKLARSAAAATAAPFTFEPAGAVAGDAIDLGTPPGLLAGEAVTYRDNGAPIGGLVSGATYYAIPVDGTRLRLALSMADAIAGRALVLDPSGATGRHTLGLEGVDLHPAGASGTQRLVLDLDAAAATGTRHRLVGDSSYLQANGTVTRIRDVDVAADGRTRFAVAPQALRDSTLTVNSITNALGDTMIAAGSSDTVTTGVRLVGPLLGPVGTTSISTLVGDIAAVGPAQLITAESINLVATSGAIGQSNGGIQTNLLGGRVDAQAFRDVAIAETSGDLRIGAIRSFTGNVALTAQTASIVDAFGDPGSDIQGASVQLRALNGGVGVPAQQLQVSTPLLNVVANDDIMVRDLSGGLSTVRLDSIAGDSDVVNTGGPGQIQGRKWNDLDGDGRRDADEPLLAGWTVFLDANGNGLLDAGEQSAVTDEEGAYALTNLGPDVHRVVEQPQAGWARTGPDDAFNGGFERQFRGWQRLGATEIATSAFGSGPTEGERQALLTNATGAADGTDLETFLDLAPGALEGLELGSAIEGSAIRRTVRAEAGATINFDWNLLTDEEGVSFEDFAFVTVTPAGTLTTLTGVGGPLQPSATTFEQETGFGTYTFTAPAAGLYTIGIGVVDVRDDRVDSALLVDRFSVTPHDGTHMVDLGAGEILTGVDFGNLDLVAPVVTGVLVNGQAWTAAFREAADPGRGAGYALPLGTPAQLTPLPWANADQIRILFSEAMLLGAEDLQVLGADGAPRAIVDFSFDEDAFAGTWTLAEPLGTDRLLLHLPDTVIDLTGNALDGEWADAASTRSGDDTAGGDFNFRLDLAAGDVNRDGVASVVDVGVVRSGIGATAGAPDYAIFVDLDGNAAVTGADSGVLRAHLGTGLPDSEPVAPAVGATGVSANEVQLFGTKWNDLDGDGQRDDGEPGLPGWRIYLDQNHNGKFDEGEPARITDANGSYGFVGVPAGTYQIGEEPQSGWEQTGPNAVVNGGFERNSFSGWLVGGVASLEQSDYGSPPPQPAIQALITNTLGPFRTRPLSARELEGFLGLQPGDLSTLGGTVVEGSAVTRTVYARRGDKISFQWNFLTNEAMGTTTDDFAFVSVPGVGLVKLADPNDAPFGSGTPYRRETHYRPFSFSAPADGIYRIEVGVVDTGDNGTDSAVLLDGLQVTPHSGFYVIDSDGGDQIFSLDFGNRELATIAGRKWEDRNGNLEPDNEPGLAGWTIYLDLNGNGQRDTGEPSDLTDANGNYVIGNVDPGTYTVAEVQQAGWNHTFPSAGVHVVTVSSGQTATRNFGNRQQTGTVQGVKWNDLNGNGARDTGEPTLFGWTVFIDLDGDGVMDEGEPSGTTATGGIYTIQNVTPGPHTVREMGRVGWEQTFPTAGSHSVVVPAGGTVAGIDFGNRIERGSVTGTKWNDLDGDGAFDENETGLDGWTIYADLNRNGQFDDGEPSDVTDGIGTYTLIDLLPGAYVVAEVPKPDWEQTFPDDQETFGYGNYDVGTRWNFGDTIGLSGDRGTGIAPATSEFFFSSGSPYFGGFARVSGGGQSGGGGPDLELNNINLNFAFPEPTDGFVLPFGEYGGNVNLRINGALRNVSDLSALNGTFVGGVLVNVVNFGNDQGVLRTEGTIDSFAIGGQELWIGELTVFEAPSDGSGTHLVDVVGGQTTGNIDFGNWRPLGDVHGVKWLDRDGDGQRDPDEPGLANWTIYADINGNGRLDDGEPADVTDEGGNYRLTGLEPGEVVVAEVTQPGWQQTAPLQRVYDTRVGADEVVSYIFSDAGGTPPSGQRAALDFGFDRSTRVDTIEFFGVYAETGTPPAADAFTFIFYGDDDGLPDTANVIATATSADAGRSDTFIDVDGFDLYGYHLDLGGITFKGGRTYYVGITNDTVDADDAWAWAGLDNGFVYGSLDRGATWGRFGGGPGQGLTPALSLLGVTHGQVVVVQAGGVADGVDFGNRRLPVEIHGTKWFDENGNGLRDAGDSGLRGWTIYLDLNDNSRLDDGEPSEMTDPDGNYAFMDVPPGAYTVAELPRSGWEQTFPTGHGVHQVDVDFGTVLEGVDFGNRLPPIEIHGLKWQDDDADGQRDSNEGPLEGVVIYLDLNGNARLDGGEPTALTDARGVYAFLNLPFSDYTVREVVPAGWERTFPTSGAHFLALDPSDVVTGVNFGNRPQPGEIHGVKWEDEDADGVFDPGERPLRGWTIFLDADGDGHRDWTERFTVTNALGQYWFMEVAPGAITVAEVLRDDYEQTYPTSGSHAVVVGPGEIVEDVDFGNRLKRARIHGSKWEDDDNDGVREPGEAALAGWTIYLDLNGNGRLDAGEPATVTNANGDYAFTNLAPGAYLVAEVLQANWEQTFPGGTSLVGVDFDDDGAVPRHWTQWDARTTPFTILNMIDEREDVTDVDLNITSDTGQFLTTTVSPPSSHLPSHRQALPGLDGNMFTFERGVFTWQDLVPRAGYEVYVFGLDLFPNDQRVSIDGDGAPVVFRQNYPVGHLYVNEDRGRSTLPLNAFAEVVFADASGRIVIDVSAPGHDVGLAGLALRRLGTADDAEPHEVEVGPGERVEDVDFGNRRRIPNPTVSIGDLALTWDLAINLGLIATQTASDRLSLIAEAFFGAQSPGTALVDTTLTPDVSVTDPVGQTRAAVVVSWGGFDQNPPAQGVGAWDLAYEMPVDMTGMLVNFAVLAPAGTSGVAVELTDAHGNTRTWFDSDLAGSGQWRDVWLDVTQLAPQDAFDTALAGGAFDVTAVTSVRVHQAWPGGATSPVPDPATGQSNPWTALSSLAVRPGLPGRITGTRWHDQDGNGLMDPGEPPLAGQGIYLDRNGNGSPDPGERLAVTDDLGAYAFEDVAPGAYSVAELLPASWVQTFPAAGTHSVVLGLGASATGLHFGNRDAAAPVLTTILVNDTDWTSGFRDAADPGAGPGRGYALPMGTDRQLDALPWHTVNELVFVFSEDVAVSADHLALTGPDGQVPGVTGFTYDAQTFTAAWRLDAPLGSGRFHLRLADAVADAAGNALDGEWRRDGSTHSGDGKPGGDFRLGLNVLHGDVDGDRVVGVSDLRTMRSAAGAVAGGAAYTALADLDGSGAITQADVDHLRAAMGTRLEAQTPPVVQAVHLQSTLWTSAFHGALAAGPGDADGFHAMPTDAGQLVPLSWSGLDTLRLVFSEAVDVRPGDLVLHGVSGGSVVPQLTTVAVDAQGRGVATWALGPLGTDRYSIELADGVQGRRSGLALDGEHTSGSSAPASGDGRPGGAFRFDFNVAVGDANRDGVTSVADVDLLRQRVGASATSPAYDMFADVNGDGLVSPIDVLLVRDNVGTGLPGAPGATAAGVPGPTTPRRLLRTILEGKDRTCDALASSLPARWLNRARARGR